MISVRQLHDEAMNLAQRAMVLRHEGAEETARRLTRQALHLEARAAMQLPGTKESEPTRSILYKSAASLAVLAGEDFMALTLAAAGMDGYPQPQEAYELGKILRIGGDDGNQP